MTVPIRMRIPITSLSGSKRRIAVNEKTNDTPKLNVSFLDLGSTPSPAENRVPLRHVPSLSSFDPPTRLPPPSPITTMAVAGAVRRSRGFVRFAVAVQYHGGSFLGFSHQGTAENALVPHVKKNGRRGTTDLRGCRSVEGRIREALDDLFGSDRWENIQASSRTDRGVHALKNTFHVDIRVPPGGRNESGDGGSSSNNNNNNMDRSGGKENRNGKGTAGCQSRYEPIERKLTDGLNFYLSRQSDGLGRNRRSTGNNNNNNNNSNDLRILRASKSPEFLDNPYALTEAGRARNQPLKVDWNARFSATQRTYVYRLMCYRPRQQPRRGTSAGVEEAAFAAAGIPFEWDRAWCLPVDRSKDLDVDAMREAAGFLVGTHDFSSFRGRSCQRDSPVVTMKSVDVRTDDTSGMLGIRGGGGGDTAGDSPPPPPLRHITLTFVADSFLYRQVRNMVGCLVEVGKPGGRLSPRDVEELLAVQDDSDDGGDNGENNRPHGGDRRRWGSTNFRHRPYSTAPPQGLFLVDVRHGGFRF